MRAKSISEFGSFMSEDDDDEEFCCSWAVGWACDRSRLLASTDDDGAIEWWFWNGCIIDKDDVRCKWDTCVIPLFKDDDTQTDIKTEIDFFHALLKTFFPMSPHSSICVVNFETDKRQTTLNCTNGSPSTIFNSNRASLICFILVLLSFDSIAWHTAAVIYFGWQ